MEVIRVDTGLYPDRLKTDRYYSSLGGGWGTSGLERIAEFSFVGLIERLNNRFPGSGSLEILEGGCGHGNALRMLKDIIKQTGRKARTTGATLNPDHVSSCEANNVDRVLVGPLQLHDSLADLKEKFHFILDSHGAAFYDPGEVIPIYGQVLVPGGFALLTLTGVAEEITEAMTRRGFIVTSIDHNHVLAEKLRYI